ncbi:hypothetical protein E4U16_007518 [Claviceps sp. LM84 group G4]|nr:hypothetical protein E4U16_007518 [Claviceps sp. LM84 group G4]
MKLSVIKFFLGTVAALSAGSDATASHRRLHQLSNRISSHHSHGHSRVENNALVKRGNCAFPTDDPDLVPVTPGSKNAGWAMSPDQECKPGGYCPFACKPGMVMAQWDPHSSYVYPVSMNGGLYCDNSGIMKKPFPQKPNCVLGTGAVKAVNRCQSPLSWCQTVLPGNEAMLIPTVVSSEITVAVPDISYWASTAAHFYVNPPGICEEGCVWGSPSKPHGNWSPYVTGANTDISGNTFVKIGWNPVWLSSSLSSSRPSFAMKIECPNGGCVGLPCEIDTSGPVGKVISNQPGVGAGGAPFCVVTATKGHTANVVTYDISGSKPDPKSDDDNSSSAPPPPPLHTTTSTQQPTTSHASPPASSTTLHTSTMSSTPLPSSAVSTTLSQPLSTSLSSASSSSSSGTRGPARAPGVFHEKGTALAEITTSAPSSTTTMAVSIAPSAPASQTTAKKGEAVRQQGSAVVGLVVAFVVAAYLF